MTAEHAGVPLHPEAVPDDPTSLRWVCPPDTLPFTGDVAACPAPLADLLGDGRLAGVRLEPTSVLTRLGEGHDWRSVGPALRTALHAALARPGDWVPAGDARSLADAEVLSELAREALAGDAGDYVRSHGGHVELVAVEGRDAVVRLSGACSGCPAQGLTVGGRLRRDLLRACPHLDQVRVL